MPRLTNTHYRYRHASLMTVWRRWPDLFRLLSPQQQRDLHRYYRPTDALPALKLIAHRRRLDEHEPSLGARAGKAFMVLHRGLEQICAHYSEDDILHGTAVKHYVANRLAKPGSGVSAVLRPEPDLGKLTQALHRLAEAESVAPDTDSDQPLARM